MRLRSILAAALCLLLSLSALAQQKPILPTRTYRYAEKDGQILYLDHYAPSPGSETAVDGIPKPTILYMFGGGFVNGTRDDAAVLPWFKRLCDDGFNVVSIDYRLGMKGVQGFSVLNTKPLSRAIQMAVEDLFSATVFLFDSRAATGIDPTRIVLAGSSAGAMSILQADWLLSNQDPCSEVLPEGFRYAGLMPFSGAVFSRKGKPSYRRGPSPTLLVHGTADKIVTYKSIRFLGQFFAGSKVLAGIFAKHGANFSIIRYAGKKHEICLAMLKAYDEEMRFIRENVLQGQKKIVDITVDDPSITTPDWADVGFNALYD